MKKITRIIHRKRKFKKSYMTPVIRRSSIFFKNVEEFKKCLNKRTYGLDGNYLIDELENLVGLIEGKKNVKIVSSGLLAISLIYLSFLKKKEYVLVPINSYKPNLRVLKYLKKKIGFKIICYDPVKFKEEKFFKKKIKLIFVEAPGSVTFEIPDIKKICRLSSKKKCILVSDNTYSCGISFKPFKYKFDISVQALTKFYSGSSDLIMGSICARKKKIMNKIENSYKHLGLSVSVDDCYLVLRNAHNIFTNFKIHEKNSFIIASYISKFSFIKKVLHPRMKDFCSNKNWKKYFNGSSGLLSFFFKKNIKKKKIFKFINSLKLFKIGYSWGGAISMVMFYENLIFSGKRIPIIVRFYIGKEDISDIKNDIKKSFLKNSFLK
ncbi:Cystathionine beta-lyase [Candidatus Vidania fulgoroideae]|nr:Cystathionine beta-lyase [Candidatus Vidania fulgoroideae]